MASFTKPISFTGGVWANLLQKMQAAGYKGSGIVSSLGIHNADAALLIYLHLTDNGSVSPTTGTDGWAIGATGGGGAGPTFFSDRGGNMSSLDLASAWVFAPTTVSVKVMAVGA
jgi:hypothetical protein